MKQMPMLTYKARKGMVIAEDILTSDGRLLVPKNTIFNSNIKTTLFSHAVVDFLVWADDSESDELVAISTTSDSDIEIMLNTNSSKIQEEIKPIDISIPHIEQDEEFNISPMISDGSLFSEELYTRTIKIQQDPLFKHYDKLYDEALRYFKNDLIEIVFHNKKINLNKILDVPLKIINSNVPSMNVFDMLINMTKKTDAIFSHSFNVSLICGVLGDWLKLSEYDTHMLMLSGLLHDIGKLMLPGDYINKPDKLTDQEFMIIRSHPVLGYNAIKDQDIDPRIKACVLMHHEKYDGSGYPSKLTGDKLPEFVKILTIADVYDAMTSDRIYRKAFSPFDVIAQFEHNGFQKYDTKILLTFLSRIGEAYIRCNALLSDGSTGEIIAINDKCLSKPIVSVNNKIINLSKETNLSIIGIM